MKTITLLGFVFLFGSVTPCFALTQEREPRTLLVTDLTDTPIPRAQVWVWITGDSIDWESVNRWELDVETERLGEKLETDDRGIVVLPEFDEYARIVAKSEELFAYSGFYRWEKDDYLLRLQPDTTLKVTVVDDETGLPLSDVPIEIKHDPVHYYGEEAFTDIRWRGSTDAHGVVIVPHAHRRVKGSPRRRLAPGFPAHVRHHIDLDPENPPEEVELRLPPIGRLEISVVGPNDEALRYDIQVQTPPGGLVGRVREGNARVRFDHVAVYGGYDFIIASTDEEFPPFEVRLTGPRKARAIARHTVRPDTLNPTVTMRILDDAKSPLANTEFWIRVLEADPKKRPGWFPYRRFESDESAIVHYPVIQDDRVGSPLVVVLHGAQPYHGDNPVARGETLLKERLLLVSQDLGDVTLSPVPNVVRGRVVDTAGAPIAGVSINVRNVRGPTIIGTDRPQAFYVTVESDSDGRFEVRGWPGTESIKIFATRGGYHQHDEVRPKARTEVKIVMKPRK